MAEKLIKLREVPDWIRNVRHERPYFYLYATMYWPFTPVSVWELKGYRTQEDVYKAAIEKGVTWQELLNHKPLPEGVLL